MSRRTGGVPVAAVFVRRGSDIYLGRYAGPIAAFEDRWSVPLVSLADGNPDADRGSDTDRGSDAGTNAGDAGIDVRERLDGIDIPAEATVVRSGEPYSVVVGSGAEPTTLTVTPVLVEWSSRDVDRSCVVDRLTDPEGVHALADGEWVSPTELRCRDTVSRLRTGYDRVRPTPAAISADTEHGSGYISVRAMEVVRDTATAERGPSRSDTPDGWETITATAEEVLAARPSMAALTNRVNRILTRSADDRTAAAVESIADEEIAAALAADSRAAEAATPIVAGETVLTLSRSGTLLSVLREGPARVFVAESRPKREGIGVAEAVADAGVDTAVCTDAAIGHLLAAEPIDAVLLGADTVLADGTVINKVGSRGAAIAAAAADVPTYVVASADKIAPGTEPTLEAGADEEIYDGDRDIGVHNPTFDATPPEYVTAFLTERGTLGPADVAGVAADHAALAAWRDDDGNG